MPKLSITTAWNETAAFVRREAGLLFPVAFGLIALPLVFLQLVVPVAAPGQEPQSGLWMLLVLPLVFLSGVATVAISALATGRETVVGDALRRGVLRVLPLIGASLLIMACMLPLAVILVLLAQTAPIVGIIVGLAALIALITLWVRLMLVTPVAAAETGGPITIIKRSFDLTRGHAAKLVGFVVLIFVLGLVITFALVTVGGILIHLLTGSPEPGSVGFFLVLLLGALLQTVFAVYFAVMLARIYAQLAGESTSGT